MRTLTKKFLAAITAGSLALTAAACSNDDSATSESSPAASSTDSASSENSGEWPRTITHELGETVIEAKPERIANTALSVTGTLLAIDAPVIASAATTPSDVTDDQGFFSQWSDEAEEAGVEVLYPGLQFDMESLIAQDPDLVIVSISGADSVADEYEQISAQFPTIAVDYSKQSWQDLATELGEALGLEEEAEAAVDEFNSYVADAATKITAPEGGVSIISYNGPGESQGVAKKGGSHGEIFANLGIDVVEAPADLDTSAQARQDFAFVTYENLTQAATGDAIFILTGTDEDAEALKADATLANLPAVQNDAVYGLGETSFRVDPYSGRLIVDTVVDALGN
ncbi:iron-enterobactin transporter periplasmic binding protein [Corynebacterium suranareeae]|uniref:Iron-enterobactin transporter periplasmic binding protein n=1 Tax=Corynebacterium suranareeae TaxID=2506452 RepID=A0A161JPB6_9CORY|nr:Fe2+-enterobactin ABC transporter substrate-binding protein [Corynebacterium suranareeae]BAU97199.1 iron-enterobactin transporter periplasmic binding protein [Corynebacterium suranareeae]